MEAVTLYTTFHEENETYANFLRRIGLMDEDATPKVTKEEALAKAASILDKCKVKDK